MSAFDPKRTSTQVPHWTTVQLDSLSTHLNNQGGNFSQTELREVLHFAHERNAEGYGYARNA